MTESNTPALPPAPARTSLIRAKQCEWIKADGERCRGNAIKESRYCFAHDPKKEKQRQIARQMGGKNSHRSRIIILPHNTPDFVFRKIGDVVGLLEDTINKTRKGELDQKTAMTIGALANILERALVDRRESGEKEEEKVKKMERLDRRFERRVWRRKGEISKRLLEREDQVFNAMLEKLVDHKDRVLSLFEHEKSDSKDTAEFMKRAANIIAENLGIKLMINKEEKPPGDEKCDHSGNEDATKS